jgi:hypothetical protein
MHLLSAAWRQKFPTSAAQENTSPVSYDIIGIGTYLHFSRSRYKDETFIIRLPKKSSAINTGSVFNRR